MHFSCLCNTPYSPCTKRIDLFASLFHFTLQNTFTAVLFQIISLVGLKHDQSDYRYCKTIIINSSLLYIDLQFFQNLEKQRKCKAF